MNNVPDAGGKLESNGVTALGRCPLLYLYIHFYPLPHEN
ncbi:hypothetical protein SAMN00120144_2070 [Hymenobacter roseosalivarius DSM 11622]|uniref:Uncharacterized protein n=1 Tax=Hymenobacter roseosalivarius DSM 11622 TaxID=645990 RepID=A0A1W1VN57_9BACT|nr:hypothetical protein SAMN00120144_2070 [Hymenobacter roseosalivarius DSM 11622]